MVDDNAPSFALRALLAFFFAWSFRAIVVLLMGAWAFIPVWLPDATPPLLRIGAYVFTVATAAGVLRAVIFIPDRFHPPTPALAEGAHPALQALILDVAAALQTRPPDHVYFLPDVNAYARESRGFLGFMTTRSLTLGMGLLGASTVSELRSTIAHELAHFVGGDTRLSLSLARTRQGMLVLIEELQDGLLARPVRFYAALFLVLSQEVSRAQELWADRAAVRIAGRAPAQSSLRRLVLADVLFNRMLERGLPFVLGCGFAPRNVFAVLRDAEDQELTDEARTAVENALRAKPAGAFDSHPPHDERIRYAEQLPEPDGVKRDDRPALGLLNNAVTVEEQQTAVLYKIMQAPEAAAIDDAEVMTKAVLPTLEVTATGAREKAGELFGEAAAASDEHALQALLKMAARSAAGPDESTSATAAVLAGALREALGPGVGALLTRVLLARGGELSFDLVERPLVTTAGEQISPFDEASRVVNEPEVAAAWLERLAPLAAE